MNLEVLVSTMQQIDHSLLKKMNIKSNAIVVNQCDVCSNTRFEFNDNEIYWFDSLDRGLSRSRNMALKYATGDICILADDDLEYVENYSELIIEQFNLFPKADIIVFQVEGIEKKFKNYHGKIRKLNYLSSLKVSSVEVAFRLKKINAVDIKFNELLGAGAKYQMGEENLFLNHSIKKGLKIIYVPLKIADLHIGESSWFKGFDKDYLKNRGAVFATMSNLFSIPLIYQFAVRKYKLYSDETSFFQAIRIMMSGRQEIIDKKSIKRNGDS